MSMQQNKLSEETAKTNKTKKMLKPFTSAQRDM